MLILQLANAVDKAKEPWPSRSSSFSSLQGAFTIIYIKPPSDPFPRGEGNKKLTMQGQKKIQKLWGIYFSKLTSWLVPKILCTLITSNCFCASIPRIFKIDVFPPNKKLLIGNQWYTLCFPRIYSKITSNVCAITLSWMQMYLSVPPS